MENKALAEVRKVKWSHRQSVFQGKRTKSQGIKWIRWALRSNSTSCVQDTKSKWEEKVEIKEERRKTKCKCLESRWHPSDVLGAVKLSLLMPHGVTVHCGMYFSETKMKSRHSACMLSLVTNQINKATCLLLDTAWRLLPGAAVTLLWTLQFCTIARAQASGDLTRESTGMCTFLYDCLLMGAGSTPPILCL